MQLSNGIIVRIANEILAHWRIYSVARTALSNAWKVHFCTASNRNVSLVEIFTFGIFSVNFYSFAWHDAIICRRPNLIIFFLSISVKVKEQFEINLADEMELIARSKGSNHSNSPPTSSSSPESPCVSHPMAQMTPTARQEMTAIWRCYNHLMDEINNVTQSLGKDGKFQLFICLSLRWENFYQPKYSFVVFFPLTFCVGFQGTFIASHAQSNCCDTSYSGNVWRAKFSTSKGFANIFTPNTRTTRWIPHCVGEFNYTRNSITMLIFVITRWATILFSRDTLFYTPTYINVNV